MMGIFFNQEDADDFVQLKEKIGYTCEIRVVNITSEKPSWPDPTNPVVDTVTVNKTVTLGGLDVGQALQQIQADLAAIKAKLGIT
jgi:hypothetical protein